MVESMECLVQGKEEGHLHEIEINATDLLSSLPGAEQKQKQKQVEGGSNPPRAKTTYDHACVSIAGERVHRITCEAMY